MRVRSDVLMTVCLALLWSTESGSQEATEPIGAALKAMQEAEALSKQGTIGSAHMAIQKYEEAVKIWKATDHPGQEAMAYIEIGKLHQALGENDQALHAYENAVPAWKAVPPDLKDSKGRPLGPSALSMTYSNIAKVYDDMGNKEKALEMFLQVIPAERALGSRYGEAAAYNNIGQIYSDLGETATALDYLINKALPIWQSIGERNGEGVTLNNIGLLYENLGDYQRALDYFNKALPLAGNPAAQGTTLNNIGTAYKSLAADPSLLPSMTAKRRQDALDYYNRALNVLEGTTNLREQARTRGNICGMYDSPQQAKKAIQCSTDALAAWRMVGDRAGEAAQLMKLGNAQYGRGLKDDAVKTLKQARALMQQVGDRRDEVAVLGRLAKIALADGNLSQARSDNESALKISQSLRTKVPIGDNRATYASTVRDLYECEIHILMGLHAKEPSKGYDVLALEASEQGRSRALVEMLTESGVNIRNGADPELLRQERVIQKSLDSMSAQLSQSPAPPQDAEKQLRDLLDRYDALQMRIRISSPRYASLVQPDPPSVRAIQTQMLTPDTLLLEYALGEGRSYLWAVGPDKVSAYTLPGRFDLEWAEGKFGAKAQRTPQLTADEIYEAGRELSKMLLGPVAGELGNKRLVIIAEGMLSQLPFGLLPSPAGGQQGAGRALAMDHEIVYLPSASTLFALRRESAARTAPSKLVAILADPVFSRDDERVKGGQGASQGGQAGVDSRGAGSQPNGGSASTAATAPLSGNELWTQFLETWDDHTGIASGTSRRRLRYTRREADGIAALLPEDQRDEATDFKASKATVNSGLLSKYRIVHIATHGLLNGVHPELSGLVLSMVDEKGEAVDGYLQLHEIYNLNLVADLVVLSACETGLGKDVTGEGVVGLTRGFMYAGSPRVVVSLWNVNDLATAELMQRFYRGMLTDKLTASQALQAAQASMLKEQRWSSPYYWGAFVLYGDWK
jgi:CHAT domain-containing protein/tetratricopeptide (TPR) repeat protein